VGKSVDECDMGTVLLSHGLYAVKGDLRLLLEVSCRLGIRATGPRPIATRRMRGHEGNNDKGPHVGATQPQWNKGMGKGVSVYGLPRLLAFAAIDWFGMNK